MKEETWENVIAGGNDRTSKNYNQWRVAVLKVRDMAEYKLFKLWKMGFSLADIEADKHHAVFPPDQPTRIRKALGRDEDQKRGRKISEKKKLWLYARACRDVADGILQFHSIDRAMRESVKKERDHFDKVMRENAHVLK